MPHGYGIHFADGRTVTVHGPRTSIMVTEPAPKPAGRLGEALGLGLEKEPGSTWWPTPK